MLGTVDAAAQNQATDVAINFATGGNGPQALAQLKQISTELGVSLETSRNSYKLLAGSVMGTDLESESMSIFKSVATAGSAMGLKTDQLEGAYLALSQIAGKGKVQAEELRGQLGERLPGAFGIAAKAMGVTQQDLNKMLETGQVTASDFLPKFAAELEKTYVALAAEQAQGPVATMNRMRNAIFETTNAIGARLLPIAMTLLNDFFIPAVTWIGQNIDMLAQMAMAVGVVWAAVKLYAFWTTIAAMNITRATVVQWLWNAAMAANPIGLVIIALSALAVGIVYLWNKWDGFRGFLLGMWEVIKETGSIINDFMVLPLMSLGKIIAGVFSGNTELIQDGINDAKRVMDTAMGGFASRLSGAFQKGWNDGVNKSTAETVANTPNSSLVGKSSFFENETADNEDKQHQRSKAGLSAIVGRGSSKNINITLDNLIGDLKIMASTVEQGADDMVDLVTRKLLQVLNTANQVQ